MSFIGRSPRLNTGGRTVIQKQEASASSDITFTIPIGNLNYRAFEFQFVNVHPAGSNKVFEFQVNGIGESGENETITSSHFSAYHKEDDSAVAVGYNTGQDQAQTADEQQLAYGIGDDADNSGSGYLIIYNPGSPTYTKNFVGRMQYNYTNAYTADSYTSGYINTSTPIDNIKFSFDSANIDSGIITMYGIGLSTTEGVYANGIGGTISYDGDYKIHSFNSSATFDCNTAGKATILVVAGGGGGGLAWAGGGGAGGLLYASEVQLNTGDHVITIGAGGAVGTDGDHNAERGSNGVNSVFDTGATSFTGTLVAIGGGGGGPTFGYNGVGESSGGDGGSGGGAGRYSRYISGATDYQSATAVSTQTDAHPPQFTGYGNSGGNTTVSNAYARGHGGGGASAVGQAQTDMHTNRGTGEFGNGGAGTNYSITGSAVGYAGGGGGSTQLGDGDSIATGSHGGGAGAGYSSTNAVAGTANTGGGGGGGASNGYSGATDVAAAGGSGVVIVRYKYK